ncbi:MAG: DUF4922 domain-containing protein [Balneolales bacterium]
MTAFSDTRGGHYGDSPQAGKPAGGGELAESARLLLRHQREHWPMLSSGFQSLDSIREREIEFDGFRMKLQFNPGRIVSASAKVDKKSIRERKCFLCRNNLPPEQKGLLYRDYMILGNPFPIFNEHFTITHVNHIPQLIGGAFESLLDITKTMAPSYTLLYNGPQCGASAPDHLHFQAGERGAMPVDSNWRTLIDGHGKWVVDEDRFRAARVDDGLRRYVIMDTDDKLLLMRQFAKLIAGFKAVSLQSGITGAEEDEPMINILSSFENNRWRIIIFLRRRHRPARYFLEGMDQILFSPASADFGGICILPVERDFEKLTAEELTEMFEEVSATPEMLDTVVNDLQDSKDF